MWNTWIIQFTMGEFVNKTLPNNYSTDWYRDIKLFLLEEELLQRGLEFKMLVDIASDNNLKSTRLMIVRVVPRWMFYNDWTDSIVYYSHWFNLIAIKTATGRVSIGRVREKTVETTGDYFKRAKRGHFFFLPPPLVRRILLFWCWF